MKLYAYYLTGWLTPYFSGSLDAGAEEGESGQAVDADVEEGELGQGPT